MNLVADIYEYVACLTDDATTLNMLSANKKFLDEKYYRRIIEKKHPYLLKLKALDKPLMTWRKFYIKNVYFILKIEELFQVPYFRIKNYYPETLLRLLSREKHPYNYLSNKALEHGKRNIYHLIVEKKFAVPMNSNLPYACLSGNLDSVKEIYNVLSNKLKNVDMRPALQASIYSGNYEILNFLLEKEKSVDLINYALTKIIFRKDELMMKCLITKGADNFDECIALLHHDIELCKSQESQLSPKRRLSLENNLNFLLHIIQ